MLQIVQRKRCEEAKSESNIKRQQQPGLRIHDEPRFAQLTKFRNILNLLHYSLWCFSRLISVWCFVILQTILLKLWILLPWKRHMLVICCVQSSYFQVLVLLLVTHSC